MKKEYSQQERERAAEQCWNRSGTKFHSGETGGIHELGDLKAHWIEEMLISGEHTHMRNLLDLQCELNRLNATTCDLLRALKDCVQYAVGKNYLQAKEAIYTARQLKGEESGR